LPMGLGAVILLTCFKPRAKTPKKAVASAVAPKVAVKPAKRPAGKGAINACNVLEVRPEARQLWQFEAHNGSFALSREQTSFPGEPLPANLVGRDWRTLFRRKLNVAWLPPEHVFLR